MGHVPPIYNLHVGMTMCNTNLQSNGISKSCHFIIIMCFAWVVDACRFGVFFQTSQMNLHSDIWWSRSFLIGCLVCHLFSDRKIIANHKIYTIKVIEWFNYVEILAYNLIAQIHEMKSMQTSIESVGQLYDSVHFVMQWNLNFAVYKLVHCVCWIFYSHFQFAIAHGLET